MLTINELEHTKVVQRWREDRHSLYKYGTFTLELRLASGTYIRQPAIRIHQSLLVHEHTRIHWLALS